MGTNVVAKVQSLLEKQRELNVDVIVANAQRTACNMSVVAYAEDGYSSGEVKELLEKCLCGICKFNSYRRNFQIVRTRCKTD